LLKGAILDGWQSAAVLGAEEFGREGNRRRVEGVEGKRSYCAVSVLDLLYLTQQGKMCL